jgi:hypothetical protein
LKDVRGFFVNTEIKEHGIMAGDQEDKAEEQLPDCAMQTRHFNCGTGFIGAKLDG